jgi:hypothetical protein
MRSVRTAVAGIVFIAALVALWADAAGAATRDAAKLFAPGANICKLVSSPAMDKAIGITFPAPVKSGTACFWQTGKLGDLDRTIVRVSTIPGLPKANTDATVAVEKKSGAKITTASLPGASEAVVAASTVGPTVSETVYGVYPQGELVVSLTGKKLTVAQALAAARVAVG